MEILRPSQTPMQVASLEMSMSMDAGVSRPIMFEYCTSAVQALGLSCSWAVLVSDICFGSSDRRAIGVLGTGEVEIR